MVGVRAYKENRLLVSFFGIGTELFLGKASDKGRLKLKFKIHSTF